MFDTPEGEEVRFHAMMCPLCDSSDWTSVREKQGRCESSGAMRQLRVCLSTRFRSESLEYRLASAYSHGHIWQKLFTAYGMETESGELVLSTDPKFLQEWFAS